MKRKICVITGSRSEYGMQKSLIRAIAAERSLQMQLIVTGAHLSPSFGNTYREIEKDGFGIDAKVRILDRDDSGYGVTRAMGKALAGFGEAFLRLRPDLVLGMGDRYELLAAVEAAVLARIPVAHLSGGEVSEGAVDDSLRHAITKLSHLHFVSNDAHRRRVIQLGEDPRKVFNVGEIGLDQLRTTPLLDRPTLEGELGFMFKARNILVTYHPVTTAKFGESLKQLKEVLKAVGSLKDTQVILTKANADAEGRSMNLHLEAFSKAHPGHVKLFTSLGSLRYLSLLAQIDSVVGNSSSGLVEAPSFKLAAVNIGDRQKGRLRTFNVIDCAPTAGAIQRAIARAHSPAFHQRLRAVKNPYGDGKSSERIIKVIAGIGLDGILMKKFHDVKI